MPSSTASVSTPSSRSISKGWAHPGRPHKQFTFCIERCSLENFIKETKSGFRYDFLPSAKLDANRVCLGHVQLAYNLAIWWKLLDAPGTVNRWTIDTLRHRILNICGNLKRYAGQWVLSLPVGGRGRRPIANSREPAHCRCSATTG